MKHSTFYEHKDTCKVYTTIKNTDYHKYLREHLDGKTYTHEDDAKLYFVPGMPLDKPFPFIEEIKN